MGARSGSLQQHPRAQRGAPAEEPPARPGPSAPPARPPRPARPRYLLAGRRLQQLRAELGALPEFPPPEAAPGPQQRLHVGPHPAARPGRGGAGGGAGLEGEPGCGYGNGRLRLGPPGLRAAMATCGWVRSAPLPPSRGYPKNRGAVQSL